MGLEDDLHSPYYRHFTTTWWTRACGILPPAGQRQQDVNQTPQPRELWNRKNMFSPFCLSVQLHKLKTSSFSSSLCICQSIVQLWNSFLAEGIFWGMCVLSTSFCSAVAQSVFREMCKQCTCDLLLTLVSLNMRLSAENTDCKVHGPFTSCSSTLFNTSCFLADW